MCDYTPSGADIAAGEVVVVGNVIQIAHLDIEDGVLGALAVGGGVYRVPKATGGGSAIAAGKRVYWDNTNNVATETASTHKILGYTVAAAADGDDEVDVYHLSHTDIDTDT